MNARIFNDGKRIFLLIPFLIVLIFTKCIFVISAAAVSDRTLQSYAVDIQNFKAAAKVEASITRASTTSQGNTDSSSLFTVDSRQEEDYSANLHPEKYLSYYSDTDDFFFSYPPHLYCSAVSDFSPVEYNLGRNVETHVFIGSEGSSLAFFLYNRMDNLNLKAAKDKILAAESVSITEKRKTLLDETDKHKKYARFVVTGYNDDGMIVYKLFKVTPDNVMGMRIICPPYRNQDDEMEKRYVQECIYRYCGFAKEEMDLPRTYTEFLRSDKK